MLTKKYYKTKPEVEVTFEVARPDVATAEWVSDLTDWEPLAMKRTPKGGPFRLKVKLPKDQTVQFRYRFNGTDWENDEAADAYWPNEHGVDNSVVFTAAG